MNKNTVLTSQQIPDSVNIVMFCTIKLQECGMQQGRVNTDTSRTTNGITLLQHELPMGSRRLHHELPMGSRPPHYQLPMGSCQPNQLHHELPSYELCQELPMGLNELYQDCTTDSVRRVVWRTIKDQVSCTNNYRWDERGTPIDLGWIYRWISVRSKVKGNVRYWPYL